MMHKVLQKCKIRGSLTFQLDFIGFHGTDYKELQAELIQL